MDQALLEKLATVIVTGATGFIGAGSKFASELKKIENKVLNRVKEEITDKLSRDVTGLTTQINEFVANYRANIAGWRLEIANLQADIEGLQQNRGHNFTSAIDYHSSDELVRRIEILEVDIKRMQETLAELRSSSIDEHQFNEFVMQQNQKALEVARLLGQIEGELKARYQGNKR